MYAERNETGDITFKVGGSKIKCHRNVLAASSLKYKAQFSGAWDIEEIIDLNLDISPLAFECFIACFYVSSPGLTHDNVQDVLEMSSMTFSENVRELCAAFLIKHIDGRQFQAFDPLWHLTWTMSRNSASTNLLKISKRSCTTKKANAQPKHSVKF